MTAFTEACDCLYADGICRSQWTVVQKCLMDHELRCGNDVRSQMMPVRCGTRAEGTDLPKCESQKDSADHVGESIVQEGVAGTPPALLDQVPDHGPAQPVAEELGCGAMQGPLRWWDVLGGFEDAWVWKRAISRSI